MKFSLIDCHCDTVSLARDKNLGLFGNGLHVDLNNVDFEYTQFFAAFIAPEFRDRAMDRAMELIKKLKDEIERNDRICLCKSYEDYCENKGKVRAFLSLEGGEAIENIESLHTLYAEGIRMATLTWNYSNHLASGTLEADCEKGLTGFGKEVVAEMNRLGIIPDVSHLNTKSFWDVMEISNKTVIASHSDSAKVCENKRNLTDEQFLAIKEKGGVVGINLYPLFVTGNKKAKIGDVIKHIEHFLSLGGENNICMGADFDGVDFLPEKINGIGDIHLVFEEMLRLGYSEETVNKLSCTNMERVLQENLCKNSKIILND